MKGDDKMEAINFVFGIVFFALCIILALAQKEEAKNRKYLKDEIERLLKEEREGKEKRF